MIELRTSLFVAGILALVASPVAAQDITAHSSGVGSSPYNAFAPATGNNASSPVSSGTAVQPSSPAAVTASPAVPQATQGQWPKTMPMFPAELLKTPVNNIHIAPTGAKGSRDFSFKQVADAKFAAEDYAKISDQTGWAKDKVNDKCGPTLQTILVTEDNTFWGVDANNNSAKTTFDGKLKLVRLHVMANCAPGPKSPNKVAAVLLGLVECPYKDTFGAHSISLNFQYTGNSKGICDFK